MAHVRRLPSVPEAPQSPPVDEKPPVEGTWYSVQNATTDSAPPSSFYTNVVANRARTPIPNEPVEEGMMSRHTSTRSTLPP